MTPEERFWAKVDRSGGPDDCWPWLGHINRRGYGAIKFNLKARRAHRFAYELLVGPIPEGLQIDHVCHNSSDCRLGNLCPHRRCVNPAHLDPKTNRDNVLAGRGSGARNVVKTHCPRGHPYAGENLKVRSNGQRDCRACARESDRRRRPRKQRTVA